MSVEVARTGPRTSIRVKLLAASAILLTGSTLLYGLVAFATARSVLLPSIREQLADDTVNVKGGLEEMLVAHYRNVRTWARLSIMREIVVQDMDKTIARFLASLQRDYGVYLDVLVFGKDGVCVASSNADDIGRRLPESGPTAIDGAHGDSAVPTMEWSDRHHAWYVRLASTIPDPDHDGEMLGTLVAMLNRDVLDRIVVAKPGHTQVELRLFDSNERLVAGRSDPIAIRHPERWQVGRGINPERFPADLPPIIHEGTDPQGRAYIVAEVPIGSAETLPTPGWRLTASIPRDLALAPVVAVRDRVFATGFGLILFALAAAALLADRLARPIKELTQVAARIARTGDLEPVPSPSSHDEVGELASAFQRMVTAVASANDEMVRTSKLAFLGEMAAGIAHEVRTPLGIIRNAAQLLERRMQDSGDKEAAEWSVFIKEESDRLARVVADLLDFVKPVPPLKSSVDLSVVVERSANLLASESTARGVVIDIEHARQPIVVACDSDQIHQVCLNLLMNAMQASSRGSKVEVSLTERGPAAELVVVDHGHGIPSEVLERLFEPFTSKRDGGIGLGLAIVRRIVRAHGGEVTARNRPEGGAEFRVTLPVHQQSNHGELR